jgi:hypothetical protein
VLEGGEQPGLSLNARQHILPAHGLVALRMSKKSGPEDVEKVSFGSGRFFARHGMGTAGGKPGNSTNKRVWGGPGL